MKKIYRLNEEFASPRIPVAEKYWLDRGKLGKVVALYTHDDMDGIFSAIEVKKYLLDKGFEIKKYGILNYTESWGHTTLDPGMINIVLDFANMPGDDRDNLIDYYLDHHGLFSEEELERYKKLPVQKKKTGSAYEAICDALGVRKDEMILSVIDMIDSAKYKDYGISWQRLLDFNIRDMVSSPKRRLEFAAAFNQFLKRSDTQTLIEVIHNTKDCSIFAIFHMMKRLYPENNIHTSGSRRGQGKDFIEDSLERQAIMKARTRGSANVKKVYTDYRDFRRDWAPNGTVTRMDGYQAIGNLVFIPSGTWANTLKARSIIEKDSTESRFDLENYAPKFILIQYGATLQVCAYNKIEETEDLPVLKSGQKVDNLGKYMTDVLKNFQKVLGYYDPDTSTGQDEITVSGGHDGIGTISNIFGRCKNGGPYNGMKWLDLFKNKIISDLSGVTFDLGLIWSGEDSKNLREPEMDNKVRNIEDVKRVSPEGRILRYGEF